MTADTRKDKRANVQLKVRYKSATVDEFIEQYAVDISRGGIFIKQKAPMPIGTLLKFEFQLKDESRLIHGVGRVVWRREDGGTEAAGMGIKFIKMDPESKVLVERIVEARGAAPAAYEAGGGDAGDVAGPAPSGAPRPRFKQTLQFDAAALKAQILEIAPKIKPYAGPVWKVLTEARRAGKRILFEGAQGSLLDIDFGTYPYVTSSNVIAGQAATGTGLGPTAIDFVLGIVKAYTTRVGEGPFPAELHDADGERLGERGHEFGTVTGRKRRCGWFDAVLVRQTCATSGVSGIALTKLDVLDGFKTLKICVAYDLDGKRMDYLPTAADQQARCTPIYEDLEGWSETTAGARSWADLPGAAIKYVRRIEELIQCPVALLSTSPERDDTILVTDPFAD